MYKLIIFDWDGTVMDSSKRIVSSMQSAALKLGLTVPSDEAIRNIIGLSLSEANKILIPNISSADNELLAATYSEFYREIDTTPTPLYKGVRSSLESLQAKGYTLAVATGKSRKGIDRVLEQTALGSVFSFSRGADETKSKPNPLMLQELLAQANVSIDQALMVGDTSYDLEMAKNLGMKSIAVSYGMHSTELLNTFDPVLVVDNFKQIEDWLDKQSGKHSE